MFTYIFLFLVANDQQTLDEMNDYILEEDAFVPNSEVPTSMGEPEIKRRRRYLLTDEEYFKESKQSSSESKGR